MVTAHLDEPFSGVVRDMNGTALPTLLEDHTVTWRVDDIGSLGWQGYQWDDDTGGSRCQQVDGVTIANSHYKHTVYPARRGGVHSLCAVGSHRTPTGRAGPKTGDKDR